MIKKYNNLSLALGVPGLLLQIVGEVGGGPTPTPGMASLRLLALLAGTGLLIAGLIYYARAKGRNPAWGLMGLLSIIGLIALALLKDESGVTE